MLLDIDRNWNTLSYTPIQSIPNMLNGWHVRWVCWPFKNWDVFSFQELCIDPCNMGLCIIMLQHEVMVVDEWHNNELQDLVTVSLCIQNAINKMCLCSLSITYACPYHYPTATMDYICSSCFAFQVACNTLTLLLSYPAHFQEYAWAHSLDLDAPFNGSINMPWWCIRSTLKLRLQEMINCDLLLSSDRNTLHLRQMLTQAEEIIRCVVWQTPASPKQPQDS